MPDTPLPELIAHRGNAAEFPENTLQSLESAVELGLRYVEFDVQLTSDRIPVVFHDADLERVADRPDVVHEITWADLAEIPVGEIKRFGPRFAFTYPPSLAQAVNAIASWKDVTAFVEIKRSSLRRFGRETVIRRVMEVLRPVLERCVVISFDLPTLKIVRLMTGARIGWVLDDYSAQARVDAEAVGPDYLFCNLERLPDSETRLWPGPWRWAIYEVRDVKTALRCQSLGAELVETMTVRGLLGAYAEHRRRW